MVVNSSETSVNYQLTWSSIPEDNNPHIQRQLIKTFLQYIFVNISTSFYFLYNYSNSEFLHGAHLISLLHPSLEN
jgi:CRISPR/Cas system CSM-associated protein Csm4 (group 5 of RAMP superfamily)